MRRMRDHKGRAGMPTAGAVLPDKLRARREVPVDLRGESLDRQRPVLLRAAQALGEGECLRVRVGGVSWPAMAALASAGCRYRLLPASADVPEGETEFLVWPAYTPEEYALYFKAPLRPRVVIERKRAMPGVVPTWVMPKPEPYEATLRRGAAGRLRKAAVVASEGRTRARCPGVRRSAPPGWRARGPS